MTRTLADITSVLRSKNADPFITTCDLFFVDEPSYREIKDSGLLAEASIAEIYRIPREAVIGVFWLDPILAVKISFYKYHAGRYFASGDPEDLDVLGAQQHVPLRGLVIDA